MKDNKGQKKDVRVAVEQSAVFAKFANFYSATVNNHEVILALGEKNTVSDDSDFIVHTKIAMSKDGAKKLLDLLSSLIKKAEENNDK